MAKSKEIKQIPVYLHGDEVSARYGVNRQTVWRWRKKDPTFPKPIKLSHGTTRWYLSDLEAWEATKIG